MMAVPSSAMVAANSVVTNTSVGSDHSSSRSSIISTSTRSRSRSSSRRRRRRSSSSNTYVGVLHLLTPFVLPTSLTPLCHYNSSTSFIDAYHARCKALGVHPHPQVRVPCAARHWHSVACFVVHVCRHCACRLRFLRMEATCTRCPCHPVH